MAAPAAHGGERGKEKKKKRKKKKRKREEKRSGGAHLSASMSIFIITPTYIQTKLAQSHGVKAAIDTVLFLLNK